MSAIVQPWSQLKVTTLLSSDQWPRKKSTILQLCNDSYLCILVLFRSSLRWAHIQVLKVQRACSLHCSWMWLYFLHPHQRWSSHRLTHFPTRDNLFLKNRKKKQKSPQWQFLIMQRILERQTTIICQLLYVHEDVWPRRGNGSSVRDLSEIVTWVSHIQVESQALENVKLHHFPEL